MTTLSCHRLIKVLSTASAGAVLTASLVTLSLPAVAVSLITDRTEIGGNDQLDWSSLGQVFDPFNFDPTVFLPNTISAVSDDNLGITVDIPSASSPSITPPFVFKSGLRPVGIPTNFADGDFILFTGFEPPQPGAFMPALGNPGPITITFDTPVKGAGTQLAVDDTLVFEAFISAFDAGDNLLATFSVDGTSSLNLDNSAVFLGVQSDTANISRLVFSSSEDNRAIGINTLSIASVPEPTSIVALFSVISFGIGLSKKVK
ncbi:MAG: PEP-CTERM sorting domain-containing protein [Microcoleaceae cyanobacterium]